MGYQALYRRYRPTRFEDFVGQEAVIKTLRSQIMSGRIAHAYLFCGTRGTGKTSTAKVLARAVNCEHPENGDPCGVCPTCKALAEENISADQISQVAGAIQEQGANLDLGSIAEQAGLPADIISQISGLLGK